MWMVHWWLRTVGIAVVEFSDDLLFSFLLWLEFLFETWDSLWGCLVDVS